MTTRLAASVERRMESSIASTSRSVFSSMVCGIDFGRASLAAARWGTQLAASGADVSLVHVIPSSALGDGANTPAIAGGLGGFGATLDARSVETLVREGRPSHWLSACTAERRADLLVLGRRGDANRVRRGEPNVIERVARRARTSVLVVPEASTSDLECVVAAVDDSDFAADVIAMSRRLAHLHEVPMIVLQVLPPEHGAYERVVRRPPSLSRSGLEQHDRTEVVVGDPVREIVQTASRCAGPLVVVGMRGSDAAPVDSIGSVARELLTRAPVPVLAVQRQRASGDG